MDSTAVTLCMENNLPILVLNLWDPRGAGGCPKRRSGRDAGPRLGISLAINHRREYSLLFC